ncbi:MAG: FtsW/RodA/SpoVE family cell cycle protein [Prosthecobacter sp.]|uniref:FtsW/RodA/SpoVE family cell cycle protein n=1 Tax=Prosthecobacter sp. TaxID=1965333 RepID=UPI003902DC06
MTPLFKKFLGMNWLLVLNMAALLVFGVYAIYNASAYHESPALALKWRDQMRWVMIGLPFFFMASLIDYKWVRWACWPMYVGGIALLLLLKQFGVTIQGNTNWLKFGSIQFQPSQFAIAAGIMTLAVVFGDMPRYLPAFRRPWLRLIVAGMLAAVPTALVAKEDLGSGLIWGPVFLSMMLAGNIPFRYIITLILCVVAIAPLGYVFGLSVKQQKRIETPWYFATNQRHKVNLLDEGWVPDKLEIAVATGGVEGKGPESKKVPDQASIHRTFFPDEAINDFIFGVVAEEFGFRGSILLLSGMALLLLQGVFVAFFARDQLGRLIVIGIVTMFFIHTFQNSGMNLTILPVIGLPMPFISYGGTFVVVTLFLMGMLQSVWVHRSISSVKKPRSVNAPRDEDDE